MKRAGYLDVREQMMPADLIAFGGKGHFSELIKRFTRYPVSHVGTVLQRTIRGDASGSFFNEIIESTSLQGFNGVVVRQLSRAIDTYHGSIWWLPLSKAARAKLDLDAFTRALLDTRGRSYDFVQAVGSAIDLVLPEQQEDFARFFCSEHAAYGLREGKVLSRSFNPSEMTPADVVRFDCWAEPVQLLGEEEELPGLGLYLTSA